MWGWPGLWIGLLRSLEANKAGGSQQVPGCQCRRIRRCQSVGIRVSVVKEHSGLWRLLTLYSELWLTANMTKRGRSGVAILGQHAH